MQTVLVRVSGPDQLGISAELFGVLAGMDAVVRDIEQIVVRRRLTLDVLIEVEQGDDVLKDLLLFGFKRGLQIDVEEVEATPTEYTQPFVITLIGEDLYPEELNAATVAITKGNGNIDRIVRLSRYPVMSYELSVSGGDIVSIRENLLNIASTLQGMDVAIQPLNLSRRAKRLVVLDVDSTLIQDEVIDLLAAQAGCQNEVSRITSLAMRGEVDFVQALSQRVALLEGLDGTKKMSKSLNNYIAIDEGMHEMFGKLMSISDKLMWRYFDLLSFKSSDEIKELKKSAENGENPRNIKFILAKEITQRFHGKNSGEIALEEFKKRFQKGEMPSVIDERVIKYNEKLTTLPRVLKDSGLVSSTSEAIRLIKQGGIRIEGKKISDEKVKIEKDSSHIYQVGKKKFLRIKIT